MARKRRGGDIFSMSFLDCMSCGFGAVILFFMIINASVRENSEQVNSEEMNEVRKIEREVLEGRKDLLELTNSLAEERDDQAKAEGESAVLLKRIRELELQLADQDDTTVARVESEAQLRADIKQLEEAKKRLAAAATDTGPSGDAVRAFVGDGSRQYLTGLRLRGKRTLILVDSSASMLDETVVNVIRRRLMPEEEQLRSAKWRQVVAAVDWITTQLPEDNEFQIYRFNEDIETLVPGADGEWLTVGDGDALDKAVLELKSTPPEGGTNLHKAFKLIGSMAPRPDNILLLVDGMPTLGENPPAKATISAKQRQNLFGQAIRQLPGGVPVNVLMYPMEGDYFAAVEYWKLAYRTGGSYMSVSDDWP